MPRLREAVKKQVLSILDQTVFTSDDFDVKFGSDQSESLFKIEFIHDDDYYFEAYRETDKYRIFECPGEFETFESNWLSTFEDVVGQIPNWALEVRKELAAKRPEYRELDSLRSAIEEALNEKGADSEEDFTVSEINDLQEKFSELEKRISELEKEQIITTAQKDKINASIQQVSNDLEVYPKNTWVKTATNKLVRTLSAVGGSKEGRAILSDGLRKLLGLD